MTTRVEPAEAPSQDRAGGAVPGRRRRHLGRRAWRQVRRFLATNRSGAIGTAIVAVYVVVAALAPLIAPLPPTEVFPDAINAPPSTRFWFGTDSNGMDVFSRTVFATQVDLPIALTAVLSSLVVGTAIGLVAGYRGGWADLLMLRSMDVLQAFPVLILALAVVAATEQSIATVVAVIAFVDTPIYARLTRAEALHIRESTYVESARSVGNPDWRILTRHVLPNAVPPVLIQSSIRLSWAVKITASLAFVGVGIQVPTPEWGAMIRAGAGEVATGVWWASVFPGAALLVLALGFNLVADGLQEHLGRRDA